MPISYSFIDQMTVSQTSTIHGDVKAILLSVVPGAIDVIRAPSNDDRNGIDYWVSLSNGLRLAVDAKVRREDFACRGYDDLGLETFSVVEVGKLGWTLDELKRTEYVLWLWQDTGRWCCVPFMMLCSVFRQHQDEWCQLYKVATQHTPGRQQGYHSECVFVPRLVVWRAIYERFGGAPVKQGYVPRG